MPRRPPRRWLDDGVPMLVGVPPHFQAALADGISDRQPFDADRRRLNVRPDPKDPRDRLYQPNLVPIGARLDPLPIRAEHVRDQGGEGSCTGQALAAVIDQQNAGRGHPIRVSARMLYQMALAYDGIPVDRLAGASLRHALKGFYHNGVCEEQLAPYEMGEPAWRLEVAMAKNARGCGLGSYYRLENTLYDYHAALNETKSIYCAAMLHEGWERRSVRGNDGRIVLPTGAIRLCGGHAFAILGYDGDGFFVLNSWGPEWGMHAGRPGIAHWSYEDWQQHVLDAWVLRLQAPSPKTFHLSGGFFELGRRPFGKGRAAMPRIEINGHYIHSRGGGFVRAGPYWNKPRSIGATADWLALDGTKTYDHLVFIADSGLEPLATIVDRAAVLTPILKAERIYPVFLIWHTDVLDRIERVLAGQAADFRDRAAGVDGLGNELMERFAETYLTPLWADLLDDAKRTAGGEAGEAVLELWRHAAPEMQVHLVAHSTGAFLLGHLIRRAAGEGMLGPAAGRRRPAAAGGDGGGDDGATRNRAPAPLASVSLLAPACPASFYGRSFRPAIRALAERPPLPPAAGQRPVRRRVAVYALSQDRERTDRFGPYAGSFLGLAAAAFFADARPLGLLAEAEGEEKRGGCRLVAADGRSRQAAAASHTGWLADEATLRDIVAYIRAATPPPAPPL